MNDTVKLIIEIPKPMYESVQNDTYCGTLYKDHWDFCPNCGADMRPEPYGGDV